VRHPCHTVLNGIISPWGLESSATEMPGPSLLQLVPKGGGTLTAISLYYHHQAWCQAGP
jgi:hypothetical protein